MEETLGVEVILDGLDNNPACPHGPTLLFKRSSQGEEVKFYACAACRDRKDCNFFWKFEDKWTEAKQKTWDLKAKATLPDINHHNLMLRFHDVAQLPVSDRAFCHTCSSLLLSSEKKDHCSHDITPNVTEYQLTHPSEILKPLESAKKEAQYLFARNSTQVIVNALRGAGIRRLLCVGSPRIHEYVRSEHRDDMTSLLLDIDHRFHQFYTSDEFCWFNSFNCHWFAGESGRATTLQFMKEGTPADLAVITDPPFGGRVEPLARTFQQFDTLHKSLHPDRKSSLPLMWIFPYFMEPMILASIPSLIMLDYKVDYDNHPLFQRGEKGRKFGSPVRIFTNISPLKLEFPKEEGYWLCEVCERWASAENRHCYKCGSCTSKNGSTYVHCGKCNRCVKPSWKHCNTCKRCSLPDHECGQVPMKVCFACHQPGHKKNNCPLRSNSLGGEGANRIRRKAKKKAILINSDKGCSVSKIEKRELKRKVSNATKTTEPVKKIKVSESQGQTHKLNKSAGKKK